MPRNFIPNEAQQRVIDVVNGPIQVIACAGSGKTATVSRRIAEMVRSGIDRDSIVAFTFTEKAAEELKLRIRQEMGRINPENPILRDMYVGTIHSFCRKILKEYDPPTTSYDIIDRNHLAAFILQHYGRLALWNVYSGDKFRIVQGFINDFNIMRRELLENQLRSSTLRSSTEFARVYDELRRLLNEYHFLDFEELINRTIRLLEGNAEAMAKVRDRYRYYTVDEYQDIDTSQERLIGLLAGPNRNLCVVGDDDQSIYKWRGARVSNFLTFNQRYGGASERLEYNYRSTKGVVDLARTFISTNQNRLPKQMTTDLEGDLGDLYMVRFGTETEELDFSCDKIRNLVDVVLTDADGNRSSIRYGDIAVLFRRKEDMGAWINRFEQLGLPFTVKGRDTLFLRPETNMIRYGFAFMATGVPGKNVQILDDRPGINNPTTFQVSEADIRTIINTCPSPIRENADRIIRYLNGRRTWFANPSSRRIQPQEILQGFIASMGFDTVDLRDPRIEAIMYDIGEVSNLFMEFETVRRLIFPDEIIDLVEFTEWAYDHADCSGQTQTAIDAISMMTIHGAKGTEFPAVFVPSLTTIKLGRTTPNRFGAPPGSLGAIFDYGVYDAGAEEIRRLLYVAITRSKKFLSLSTALQNIGYTNNQRPHSFFIELEAQNQGAALNSPMADPTARERAQLPPDGSSYLYPTSYSELRYFINCPYDFMMRNLFKLRPMIDSSFGYGSAVHNVLRRLHKEYEDGGGLMPSATQIAAMVEDPDTFYLRYSAGSVEAGLKQAAKRVITSYVASYGADIGKTFRAEVPFEFPIDDPTTGGTALVSGSIDLMERKNARGEVTEVDVVDFKTSESPTLAWDSRVRDAEFQIRLYAKATQTNMDIRTARGFVHYLNDGARIPVDVSDMALNQVETAVVRSTRGIVNRQFVPSPTQDKCPECDHRDLCRFKAIRPPAI